MVASPVQDFCKAVTQCTASCISDMHRACWVGRYKFHQNPLACSGFGLAVVIAFRQNGLYRLRKPLPFQEKVHEARACNFCLFKTAALQLQFVENCLCNLSRRHPECLCIYHCNICGKIAMAFICRNFNLKSIHRLCRQCASRNCTANAL